jgi:hypothetical protein
MATMKAAVIYEWAIAGQVKDVWPGGLRKVLELIRASRCHQSVRRRIARKRIWEQ